jgi:hypothetical protein
MRSQTPTGDELGAGETRCQNCGAYVSHVFARVFGNNEHEVHGCLECSTTRELRRGAGTITGID